MERIGCSRLKVTSVENAIMRVRSSDINAIVFFTPRLKPICDFIGDESLVKKTFFA